MCPGDLGPVSPGTAALGPFPFLFLMAVLEDSPRLGEAREFIRVAQLRRVFSRPRCCCVPMTEKERLPRQADPLPLPDCGRRLQLGSAAQSHLAQGRAGRRGGRNGVPREPPREPSARHLPSRKDWSSPRVRLAVHFAAIPVAAASAGAAVASETVCTPGKLRRASWRARALRDERQWGREKPWQRARGLAPATTCSLTPSCPGWRRAQRSFPVYECIFYKD